MPPTLPGATFPLPRMCTSHRLRPLIVAMAATTALLAGAGSLAGAKADKPNRKDVAEEPVAKPDKGTKAERKQERPADAGESRTNAKLRERLEVKDDAEWQVILERITRVEEARRLLSGKGRPVGQTAEKGRRPTSEGADERNALRSAVADRLTDAELRARLSRAHEAHLRLQHRLNQAEADLRAVLSVRQEAIAVLAGLLSP